MNKAFQPLSVIVGLLAGMIAKKVFARIWGEIADEEAPDPEHRDIPYGQLAIALALEGAIQRLVRGFVDHGLRRAWSKQTGVWPGDEEPDPM